MSLLIIHLKFFSLPVNTLNLVSRLNFPLDADGTKYLSLTKDNKDELPKAVWNMYPCIYLVQFTLVIFPLWCTKPSPERNLMTRVTVSNTALCCVVAKLWLIIFASVEFSALCFKTLCSEKCEVFFFPSLLSPKLCNYFITRYSRKATH